MALSVSQFIAAIKGELSNAGNSKVDTQLRQALVHALSRVSPVRTTWNEATFSFTSTINVGDYDSTIAGFPKDAAEFDLVEVQNSSSFFEECRPCTLLEVRERIRSSMGNGTPYPDVYTWYAQKLMFAPVFTQARTVQGYYQRDARRDQYVGTLIDATTASDLFVNQWFIQGEDLLWAKTLEIFHARFAVDGERASYYERMYEKAKQGVGQEWVRKRASGLEVEGYI